VVALASGTFHANEFHENVRNLIIRRRSMLIEQILNELVTNPLNITKKSREIKIQSRGDDR